MLNEKGKRDTRTGQEGQKECLYSSTVSLTPGLDGVGINAMPLALYPPGQES